MPLSEPARHSSNRVGVPTGLLASAAFNQHPLPLHIAGVRDEHRPLFDRLAQTTDMREAATAFVAYMDHEFGLTPPAQAAQTSKRFRPSYLRLLKGWGFESNSPEGAVLKGWVESRFGIVPTFHKAPLSRIASPAWSGYVEEKMSHRFHDHRIGLQLDLLYEFSQWALAQRFCVGRHHLTLFRGVNDFTEHRIIHQAHDRNLTLRLNNLVSFSRDRAIAGEFGDYVLETQVPVVKILFFNELLPRHPLKGEAEYLVIGGDYRVKVAYL